MSAAAIAQAIHPVQSPYRPRPVPTPYPGPMAAAPTIAITIVNAEPTGDGVAFAIDGVTHQAPAGSRQDLAVAPDSHITYDAGGSLGQRRYRISTGVYEFRSTAAWLGAIQACGQALNRRSRGRPRQIILQDQDVWMLAQNPTFAGSLGPTSPAIHGWSG